jgi:glycerol-3-phosphate dehydrogenase (NAD(P)+)
MGKLLGSGLRYRDAKTVYMPDDTVEGAELALVIGKAVKHWIQNGKIVRNAVPLALAIIDAVCENQPLRIPWSRFYTQYAAS